MEIYRLYPRAEALASNWDIAANHGVVVVRAKTSGDARLVAAEAEARAAEPGRHENDDVFSVRASAFTDDKLYGVQKLETADFSTAGERAVLAGEVGGARS